MGDLDLHLQGRLVHFHLNLSRIRLVRMITHEEINLDSPNLHQICILHRPRLGLLMVDLYLHLQGRSVHFLSNLSQQKTNQDRLIAGPRGFPSGTDALVMVGSLSDPLCESSGGLIIVCKNYHRCLVARRKEDHEVIAEYAELRLGE